MSGLGAFIVGMGSGYLKAREKAEDDAKAQKERDQVNQLRQMQIDDLMQKRSDDQALRGATADTVIGDSTAGPMPDGQVARVQGKGYASMADALTAKAAADMPDERLKRRQAVLSSINPMQAAQERLTLAQTDSVEQDLADKVYARGLARSLITGGWDDFTKQLSDSPFGGKKFGLTRDAKAKKVRISVLGDDGKDTGDGMDFSDDEDGRMKALNVAMSVSNPQARMDYYKWAKENNQKQNNWLAEMGLKERELGSQERYRTSMASAAGMRAENSGGNDLKIPDAVKLQIEGIDNDIKAIDQMMDVMPADKARRIELSNKRNMILGQYSSGGQKSTGMAPDPLGLRGGSSGSQGQSGMDESTSLSILQNEYGGDVRRAQADVASLQSELSRKGLTAESRMVLQNQLRVATAAAGAKPAQQPAQSQVASMAASQPAQEKPKPTTAQILAEPIKGNAILEQMAAKKAAPIDAALTTFKTIESQFLAAAKSGDANAVQAWQIKLQSARAALEASMKDLPDQTKAAILATASN